MDNDIPSTEQLERIRQFFVNDRFATGNGMELIEVGPGTATARLVVEPRHFNGIQTVQGGALFTLADFAFAAACNSWGEKVTGINMSIQCLKAVRTGTLTALAKEVARSRKLSTCEVSIRDERGQLVALFQGTGYVLGGSLLE